MTTLFPQNYVTEYYLEYMIERKRGRVSNSIYSCANALRIIKFLLARSNKL